MKASSIEAVNLMNTAVSEKVSKQNGTKESSFSNIINSLSDEKQSDEAKYNNKSQITNKALESNEALKKKESTKLKDTSGSNEESVDSLKTNHICEEKLESNNNIEESAQKIKDALLKVLGVSEEDLEAAMQVIGISYLDCFDKNNLAQLLTKLTGNSDISTLITDETLYQKFIDLTTVVDGIKEEMLTALGMTEDEFTTYLQQLKPTDTSVKDTVVETQAQNQVVDNKPKEPISTNANDAKEMINVTSISSENAKVNAVSNQTQNENNQQFDKQSNDLNELPDANDNLENNVQRFVPRQETLIDNQDEQVLMSEPTTLDTESLIKQIQNQLKVSTSFDNTKLEFQLNPENLGKLTIQLASKDGMITAQITTQNAAVKEVIESQILLLRENMNNQGLKVEAVEVTVESHEFERNLEQGNSNTNQEQYEQQQKKTRRLMNFNDPESLEDLSEEETLAANIMIGNGNSLNYTI